ncbi:tetratricopeptide repeat protein [Streptacidiphilus sp. N1-10]|uniref:Tetratricopeptide repeat protein n=1 Tax=Streptacidiphilus jeojiensis TaxID=3229225 RepID=A0ABV6XXT4_9ACTN
MEAEALAVMLRRQVDSCGKTLAELAKEIHSSRTQLSVYLSGAVPRRELVLDLVKATTADPRMCERRRAEALGLLDAAQHPAPGAAGLRPSSVELELAAARVQQIETYDRLTRALEQRDELREAEGNSRKLVIALHVMIDQLEHRVTVLTQEGEQLRAAHAQVHELERTREQLTRATVQVDTAKAELDRARSKQRQAEELTVRVQEQVRQLTDELDRLRGHSVDAVGDPVVPQSPHDDGVAGDPVGDDVDQALVQAAAVNDADADLLDKITGELADTEAAAPVTADDLSVTVFDRAADVLARLQEATSLGETGDAAGAVRVLAVLVEEAAVVLGPDHPYALSARVNSAHWRGRAGDRTGAVAALKEVLVDQERVLGPAHFDTVDTQGNIVRWLAAAGEPEEAAAALEHLLEPLNVLDQGHPDALTIRYQMALLLAEGAGNEDAALATFQALLVDQVRVLGPDHHDTLATRHQIALGHWHVGDVNGATARFQELLPDQVRVLGPQHRNSIATRRSLARWQLGSANS